MEIEEAYLALGLGYVQFAQENPTTYQIMFGTVVDDFSPYPDLAQAAEDSYAPVLALMERIIASRPGWDMTTERLGAITWSAVHGIASLLIFAATRSTTKAPMRPGIRCGRCSRIRRKRSES